MVDAGTIAGGVNTIWILTVTFLIFFMQPGFALLEAGQVRSKNVANALMKNMMGWGVGVITYFLVGAGIAMTAATIVSAADAAALTTTFTEGKPDPLFTANGLLAGLVVVTGAVPHVTSLGIALWTIIATYITFKLAEATIGLRVSEDDESDGLNQSEHGFTAYPEFVECAVGTGGSTGQTVVTDGRGGD